MMRFLGGQKRNVLLLRLSSEGGGENVHDDGLLCYGEDEIGRVLVMDVVVVPMALESAVSAFESHWRE